MKKIITDIKNGIYLKESNVKLYKYDKNIENNVIRVYPNITINKYYGMGGAITYASSYNYSLLDNDKKESLLNHFYSKHYLNYSYGRISIGSNDFCPYSYEYVKNEDLDEFDISEDEKYIIPMLNDIYKIKQISLMASPWSPPRFMKKKYDLYNGVELKKEFYELYSNYLLKFIEIYKEKGFKIDYLSIQNEPYARQRWESCFMDINTQKDIIYNHLIEKIKDVKTIMHDHNRENIINITKSLYSDKVNTLGIHYYTGTHYDNIKYIHEHYKDLLIINTEMCTGFSEYDKDNWINDAEHYLKDIISSFNNGVGIYLDWNLFLDYNGGPSHKENYCKSAIILNEDKTDFILTPIYYYLYHISHFFNKNDDILLNSTYTNSLYILCSKDVVIILNPTSYDKDFNLIIEDNYIKDRIPSHTIITYYTK